MESLEQAVMEMPEDALQVLRLSLKRYGAEHIYERKKIPVGRTRELLDQGEFHDLLARAEANPEAFNEAVGARAERLRTRSLAPSGGDSSPSAPVTAPRSSVHEPGQSCEQPESPASVSTSTSPASEASGAPQASGPGGKDKKSIDRRRAEWKALTGSDKATPVVLVPVERSLSGADRIDGIEFSYPKEPRCRVCAAGLRRKGLPNGAKVRERVDDLLVGAWTYQDILIEIGPLMADWPSDRRITYNSIRNHQQRHLPADQFAVRQIVERRAADLGLNIAVGRGPLLTHAAVLELVRQRGFEALTSRSNVPNVKETMQASDMLERLEEQSVDALATMRFLHEQLIDVLRKLFTPEHLELIQKELEHRLLGEEE